LANILVVGTHPDDIELGIGGSVAKWVAEGHAVTMLDLTNGEPTPHGSPETRAKESAHAAAILGVTRRITLDLPNREVTDTVSARRKVAEVYREIRPQLLLIQSEKDSHPDHLAAATLTLKARFDAKLTKTEMKHLPYYPRRVIRYLASHLPQVFEPTFIHDVSSTFHKKLEVIAAYHSQFAANGTESFITNALVAQGRYYGSLIGVEYGEPFATVEPLGLNGLGDIVL
jgi:bacillithiol biosynthesis deacetylase BshB1